MSPLDWICGSMLETFRVILKKSDDDALEECMLVMKPCDPEAPDDADECLDEEVKLCVSADLNEP